MAKPPAYRNPETGLLRCPIRELRDCVKEQCFFWKDGTEIDLMLDIIKPLVPPHIDRSEFEKDNCSLLAISLLAESLINALGQLWRAGDALVFDELWPPATPSGASKGRTGASESLSRAASKRASRRPSVRPAADESGLSKRGSVAALKLGRERGSAGDKSDTGQPRLVLVDSTVSRKLDILESQLTAVRGVLDALSKKS